MRLDQTTSERLLKLYFGREILIFICAYFIHISFSSMNNDFKFKSDFVYDQKLALRLFSNDVIQFPGNIFPT